MTKLYRLVPVIWLASCGLPKANQPMQDSSRAQAMGDSGVSITQVGDDQEHTLSVLVGGNNIDISYTDTGFTNFDGYGATMRDEDKAALKKAAEAFAEQKNLSDQSPIQDQVIYKVLDYLSNAPTTYSFDSNRYEKQFALANEGITCIKKNTTVKAEWNTRAVTYVSQNIVVGVNWPNGYGCMGRCGADCGNWLPSSWTKDCMDHDACSSRNAASGGAADSNCGDEYNEAADDWTFGVVRGCSG